MNFDATQQDLRSIMSKGDPTNARLINTALVLDQLRRQDLQSRTQIARELRLSKMTVSAIVNDLIDAGMIKESGQGDVRQGGGRKPILLTLNSSDRFVVGVDVGTTNMVVAIGNLKGELAAKQRVLTVQDHQVEQVLGQVVSLIEATVESAGVSRDQIFGIGLSVAGLVNKQAGLIELSPDLNWRNVSIRKLLKERTGLDVVVDNCTRAMTLAERWYGTGKDVRDLFYVNIGYGIGSALVVNGEIYSHNSEFGHVFITQQKVRCDCGNFGCLEAISSGQAIERVANKQLGKKGEEWITVQRLAAMAREGNEAAASIFTDAGKYLGRAISYATNLYNPQKVVLGGGVALAGDLLLGSITEEFQKHAMPLIRETTEIEISTLGIDAGVVGAVGLALNSFVFGIEHINHLL